MAEPDFCPFKDDKPCTTDCAWYDGKQCSILTMTQYLDSINDNLNDINFELQGLAENK